MDNIKIEQNNAQTTQIVPDPLSKKKPVNWKRIVSIAVAPVLLLVIGSVYIASENNAQKNSQTLSITPTPSIAAVQKPQEFYWVLRRNDGKKPQNLISFDLSSYYIRTDIVKWNNFLFYEDPSSQKIISHDITTGETKAIHDAKTSGIKSRLSYGDYEPTIREVRLVNDILFFSVGVPGEGFTSDGATYALDLPPKANPQKLIDFPGEVKKIGNNYFIVRMDGGENCGGRGTYATVDIATKRALKITETRFGCQSGEEFIDVDKKARLIVAYHNGTDMGAPDFGDLGIYDYVLAISLANPFLKEGLIAKQDMPQGITSIKYLEDRNQLLLVGKTAYIFDLVTNKLNKITDFPTTWRNVWIEKQKENSVCVRYPKIKGQDAGEPGDYSHGAEINLATNQLIEKTTVCQQIVKYNSNNSSKPPQIVKTLKDKIKTLNLPASYELVQEMPSPSPTR